ncbi:MAG: hypothetical protein K1X55_08335 [Chitinophagales bacterium]|nr:hypothetical protein [Chitinophagales bacterium]
MESDGKFNKNFVVNRIKEYNIDYLNNYIKDNCLDGDVSSFLLNELEFMENKIKENINYGFGKQLFQHQKKIIYDYCKLNKIDLKNGFTPPQNLTFNSKLIDKQIDIIVDLINDIKLFDIYVDKTIFSNLLDCNLNQPLSTNTTNFTQLFNELSIKKFITNEYQSIVSKSKLFKGTRGKFITDKNLSSTLQKIDKHNEDIIKITNIIKNL